MSIDLDVSELRTLAADLGKIPGRLVPEVDGVLKRGALAIKDDLNKQFADSRHFKGAAGSVTFDSTTSVGQVSYEIGPDKDRRGGALANIFFFGGAHGGGGTGDLDGAIGREEPKVVEHLERVVGGLR